MKGSLAITDVRHAFHIYYICGEMSVYLRQDLVFDRTIYIIRSRSSPCTKWPLGISLGVIIFTTVHSS